ncbi:hypothetical protein CF326_g2214 [Tilletia indica]|nr:hypothetical protein CF326_g2214 [Tilletia indica]
MSSKKMDSSSLAAAALNTLPSRSALQQHAAHSLSLSASLTLPPSSTLASLLQEAEQRASLATQHQQQAKEDLLAHLQHTADSDRTLTSTLSALPEQIDECDEAILTLSSPTALALEKTLHSHIQARTKLQTARDYFNLLASAEDLRIQALATDKDDVKSALPALSKLSVLYDQAEALLQDERIRGLVFIRAQRDFTFHELRKRAINNLRAACEAAGWSPTAAAAAASSVDPSQTNAQTPPVRRLDAHKEVQHAWKDLCRFQRTAERLGLMPRATAPLLQMDSAAASDDDVTTEQAPRPGSPEYVPLLAVTILLDVLLLRFRYHFDSSRPSNRLDKPEWYLSHILGLVRAYGIDSDLFRPGTGSVARLCALGGWGRAHGVVPTTTTNKNGAVKAPERMLDTGAELLHGLLVPLRAKLIASMPLLLPHPALLAHTISEYIVFDDALRQTYPPSNLDAPDTTRGPALSLADQVLNNSEWFAAWLEGERAHAEERLDEILNAGDAWAIQSVDGVEDEEDGVPAAVAVEDGTAPVQRFPTQPSTAKGTETNGQTPGSRTVSSTYKTVRSAQQIVELLESVQDRAAPLPLLTHRLAFFARIQLPLLRAYADRLTRSLDAFESLSKAFARAMPGAIEGVNLAVAGAGGPNLTAGSGSNAIGISSGGGGAGDADMVRGLRGLGRLLKAHLSAAHIVDTLSRWNDTAYFLALSLELRETEEGKKLAVELAVADGEAEEAELDNASLVSLLRKSLRRQGGGGGGGMDVRGRGAEFVAAAGAKIRSRSTSRSREASVDVGGGRGRVGGVEGGVWDDILVKYRGLLRRATVAMERLVVHEIVDALKPYAYRRWDEGQIEDEDDLDGAEDDEEPSRVVKQTTTPAEPIPTPSLLPALTLLSTHLGHLLPALPSHYALPIYRSIAGTLSTQIVDRVVMSGGAHRFTYAGGQRFARDIEAGWFGVLSDLTLNFGGRRTTSNSSTAAARLEAAHEAMGRRPRAAWRELEAVGTLLSLSPTLPPTKTNEDESATTTTNKWTLERTTRALFEADEEDDERGWSAVRRELKMEGGGGGAGLMHGRAREVVRRRIECAR